MSAPSPVKSGSLAGTLLESGAGGSPRISIRTMASRADPSVALDGAGDQRKPGEESERGVDRAAVRAQSEAPLAGDGISRRSDARWKLHTVGVLDAALVDLTQLEFVRRVTARHRWKDERRHPEEVDASRALACAHGAPPASPILQKKGASTCGSLT